MELSEPLNLLPQGMAKDSLAEGSDRKLHEWTSETAEQVRSQVAEIIELADEGLIGVARSRTVEQEVLDSLDEPKSR
jgi:hypothetical protein